MKTSFIVMFLLSLVLFSACEFLGYDEEIAQIVKSGDPKDCDALEGEDAKKTQTRIEKCYDSYAQKHEMPELCDEIKVESKHDDCYEDLAEQMERLDLCDELKGKSDSCVSNVAIAKNDESICEQIDKGAAKDRCNQEIGKNKKSVEICELIDSNSYKDNCLEHIALEKEDIEICEKLSRYNKDGCIQQIAVNQKDISLCERSSEKEDCIERVNTAIGEDIEDIDLEEELDDDELDDELLEELEDETTKPGVNLVDGKLYINSAPGEVLRITSSDLPSWASAQMVVVGASTVCVGPPSAITTGDENVILNGLPVARINDKTAHGGTVVVGSDKIFINGVAAAFVGANTVCPLVNPGPVPHVGGPISSNGY